MERDMTERYAFIDLGSSGADAIATAFANQVAYCTHNGALITARVCAALGKLIASGEGGAFLSAIRDWPGAPIADALPLRAAGGLHALHLAGDAPSLAPLYAGDDIDDAAVIADVVATHEQALMPWLDGPPQTNEAGRSSNFIAAMLALAHAGLPSRFEAVEIGSSAGINLMIDRYHYDLAGVHVGPAYAPAALHFAPEWRGPPPPAVSISFASLAGCDVAPVDLTDPAQALRLRAYVWPEQAQRFARIDAAIALAMQNKPDLVAMNAADFVEQALARPQSEGTTRVLMHSIVWQYVPTEQQARVTAAMEAAGARATPDRPLAWIALEANRTVHHHELVVRHWPAAPEPRKIATAHAHGAWVEWTG
jgi:hypothetical protein